LIGGRIASFGDIPHLRAGLPEAAEPALPRIDLSAWQSVKTTIAARIIVAKETQFDL
jgi:hypothetical protein